MEINIPIAFLAGLLSFFSPCIFPIIPSYLSYIGAATYDDGFKRTKGAMPLIISFIIGFTIVFSIMGVIISTLGFAFRNYSLLINRISGILVIILGLNFIFNFLSFLDYEKKAHIQTKNKGILSSVLLGVAFGAGWSPCIGPILASILFMAGNSGTILSGLLLLLIFSLGLAVPFLASGIFISQFREKSVKVKENIGKIKVASGTLIILIGLSIFLNKLSTVNIVLGKWATQFYNWYQINIYTFNNIVSILFLIIPGITIFNLIKKRRKNSILSIIIILLGFILSTISFLGILNWGDIISNYLNFQGI